MNRKRGTVSEKGEVRLTPQTSRLTYSLFLFLLLAPPLTFYGIDRQWTLTLMEAGCAGLFLWVVVDARRNKRPLFRVPGLLPLTLFCIYILLQLLPLPPSLLAVISPKAFEHYQVSVWLLEPSAWMPLSIYPKATLELFFRFASYALFFLTTIQLLNNTDRLRKTAFVLSCFGGLYAFLGLLQFFAPGQRIFWFLALWPGDLAHKFGSYVNHNHYAGLMEMMFPLVLTCFFLLAPKVSYGSWRDRLIESITEPSANRHILVGISAVLMIVSIFFSLSRSGMISIFLATFLLLGLITFAQCSRGKAPFLLLILICTLGLVGLFGWQPVAKLFEKDFNASRVVAELRPIYWKDSLELIADYPLFGAGFGSFVDSYPRYQTADTGEKIVWHAHNDYLELVADGGLVGLLLAAGFLVSLLRQTWPAWRHRRNNTSRYLYMGSFCGVVAILLHSVTDFNLAIPPNGLFFFFLCGLMVASANVRSGTGRHGNDLTPSTAAHAKLLAPLCILLLVGGLMFNGGGLLARGIYAPLQELDLSQLDRNQGIKALERIQLATTWDPLESRYRYAEAKALVGFGQKTATLQVIDDVLRLRPMSGVYLQKTGMLIASLGELDLAGSLFRAGLEAQPNTFKHYKEYGTWLLTQQQTEEALAVLRRGLQQCPNQTSVVLILLADHHLNQKMLRRSLPERAESWQIFADYLVSLEQEDVAESAYRHALLLTAGEIPPSTKPFWSYYKYLQERKRESEALSLMLAGIKQFPQNADFHSSAGSLYEKQGISYRAIEEYQLTLLLDPKLDWVRQRLGRLLGDSLQ